MDYENFLEMKSHRTDQHGFEPVWMLDDLFDFQKRITTWAIRKGRSAVLADCGLGKTLMQLTWAQNILQKTNKPVLIVTPLAVSQQTKSEGEKFGIETVISQEGKVPGGIVITNYERIGNFDPADFSGVVCDESSILKSYQGKTRKQITRFMSKLSYRLLCTATAAPNDYIELGTSSEALGELSHSEMLKRFFRQLDDKGQKKELRDQQQAEALMEADPNYFRKLSYRVSQTIGQWRLKHHAKDAFWRWVASWALACRKPSDMGFLDDKFKLPELIENDHVIVTKEPPPGMLFNRPAIGLGEERAERRRTMQERCEFAANLVDHNDSAVIWCHMNDEGDKLEEIIPDAVQIAGKTPDEKKLELYQAFQTGQARVLVIKPKIGAWGLNWQHCNHVVSFATHSFEQDYQAIRRCWRFGQARPVTVDRIATEGEVRVLQNMRSKSFKAVAMFDEIIDKMHSAKTIQKVDNYTKKAEAPAWL